MLFLETLTPSTNPPMPLNFSSPLLFDRPIILLANDWLIKNFPDIGIKTDIDGLENAIRRSISSPEEFSAKRK